ncbi:UNVERIFIED_CONTAM: hypothetical protein K2H54_071730 [Gekko kuhli]
MKVLLIPPFIAVPTLGILVFLLALCILCRRKHSKQAFSQDGVSLVDAPARSPEHSESAAKPQKLKRADSRGKDRQSASFHLQLPLREDDGTTSVSSFTIVTQRQLPQIPSEDLPAAEETYSNLTFPSPAQEVLYESVAVKDGERDQPGFIEVEEGLPRGGEASRAEYACVLKVKKKEEATEVEAGGSPGTPPQQPCLAKTAANPQTVPVEAMYSVVNKAGKKKKKTADFEGNGEETSHRNGQLAAVHQGPDSRAEPRPSSSLSPVTEPCYDSVSHDSWLLPDGREGAEPAYETVDAHWKPSRRKGKASPNKPENLYESI